MAASVLPKGLARQSALGGGKNAGIEMVLLKVPASVASTWRNPNNDRIGTIKFAPDGRPLSVRTSTGAEFELDPMSVENVHVMSHSDGGITDEPQVEGRITSAFNLVRKGHEQGIIAREYHAELKKRRKLSEVKTANAVMLPTDDAIMLIGSGGIDFSREQARPLVPKAPRERMSKDALEDMLYRLFEGHGAMTMKELKAAADQPEAWLKEVADGIAKRRKRRGNTYEWHL